MTQFSAQEQKREYQNKERKSECHLSEQSVAYVMYRLPEASGSIHNHCKEQKQSDGYQGNAPDNIVVSLIAVAPALHLVEHFLFCRISRVGRFFR